MVQPATDATTERLYSRGVPEFYRVADELEDWLLLYIIESVTSQVAEVEAWVDDQLDFGTLFDPMLADAGWLGFLGQLVSARLQPTMTEAEERDAILYASGGWRVGTKKSIVDAAKSALTGTKYAKVYDHSTEPGDIGTATMWDVLLVTRTSETPDLPAVLEAIRLKQAVPAGVTLYTASYDAEWATIESNLPTWDDWEALTWDELQEEGLG